MVTNQKVYIGICVRLDMVKSLTEIVKGHGDSLTDAVVEYGSLTDIVKEHGSLTDAVDYMADNIEAGERGEMLANGLVDYVGDKASLEVLSTYINRALGELVESKDMDDLTGIPKRATLKKRFKEAYSMFDRSDISFALMVVDIDFFKKVNDDHGHLAGDAVLKEFAGRINYELRDDLDFVCRYGGEEFVVLYSDVDAENVLAAANHLQGKIGSSGFDIGKREPLDVTFSGGLHIIEKGDDLDKAFAKADEALYYAKDNGRDRIVLSE